MKLGKEQEWGLKPGAEAAREFTCDLSTSLETNFTEASYNSHAVEEEQKQRTMLNYNKHPGFHGTFKHTLLQS